MVKVESSNEGETEFNEQRESQHDTTLVTETTSDIALRTVPVCEEW